MSNIKGLWILAPGVGILEGNGLGIEESRGWSSALDRERVADMAMKLECVSVKLDDIREEHAIAQERLRRMDRRIMLFGLGFTVFAVGMAILVVGRL